MLLKFRALITLAVVLPASAGAEIKRGQFTFSTERNCAAAGTLNPQLCANAAANAQAEFDEKAPRFPTRAECEAEFGKGGCSIGFSGAAGWAGRKSGIYFTPRQSGFRILASSERNIVVVPFVAGRVIGFSSRTILERATQIDFRKARQARESWRDRIFSEGAARVNGAAAADKSSNPTRREALPLSNDPNFDCAAVLEAGADPSDACYPAAKKR